MRKVAPRVLITPLMRRKRRLTLRVWAQAVVRARLLRMQRELARLERAPDADAIHDTRVAGRRLRAALRHLEPCFPSAKVENLRTDIRRLARLLGTVRDLDILIENVAGDARRRGSPVGALLVRLRARRENILRRSIPEARRLRLRLPMWRARLEV